MYAKGFQLLPSPPRHLKAEKIQSVHLSPGHATAWSSTLFVFNACENWEEVIGLFC